MKSIIPRARAFVSFARIVRWGLIAVFFFVCMALLLDIFIFYRYSYRVVNLKPDPVIRNITIDRVKLQKALEILDGRAEKFKELYGSDITTPR